MQMINSGANMNLETISLCIIGFSVLLIVFQLFGVLAGADGWGFSKSLLSFLIGMIAGFVFGLLLALYFTHGKIGPSVAIAALVALLSGKYVLHRYWSDYYYTIVAIPFMITAVLIYCLMRFQFGWHIWWKPLLVAVPVGYFIGWCYWLFHRFVYPYVWVLANSLTIAAAVTAVKIALFRKELLRSIIDNYQKMEFWRALPSQLDDVLVTIAIVWLISVIFIFYIWYIQRFKEKWRKLITDAKEREANPYGGLVASFSMAMKGFRQTTANLFIFRRVPV